MSALDDHSSSLLRQDVEVAEPQPQVLGAVLSYGWQRPEVPGAVHVGNTWNWGWTAVVDVPEEFLPIVEAGELMGVSWRSWKNVTPHEFPDWPVVHESFGRLFVRRTDVDAFVARRNPERVQPRQVPTDLYRYFNGNDVLLYVGVSLSAVARAAQHKQTATWWSDVAYMTRQVFPSRPAALDAERVAIRTECPLHNIVGRRNDEEDEDDA